jgi:T5orf172 domain
MPRPRPKYLNRATNRHGKTIWYARIGSGATRKRIRILSEYGTPEFDAEYQAALGGHASNTATASSPRATPAFRLAVPRGYLYVIGPSEGHVVKIGISAKPKSRMRQLQTGNASRLEILASCRGGKTHESVIHQFLAASHLQGEWFERSPAVEQFISFVRSLNSPAREQSEKLYGQPSWATQ